MRNDASGFYDSFANKYDLMVSDERYDEVMPFFRTIFEKHHVESILDCSCGTGKQVLRFSQAGYEVKGSDISAKMIREAKRNAKEVGADVDFVQADFKKLTKTFERKFDCVVCWGNSLGHELGEKGILSALRGMYGVLRKGGIVIIQIRNLPKWVRERKRIIPMHYHKEPNGDRKVFIYALDYYRTRVRFNVISLLESNGTPKFEVDSVNYRVVSGKRLKKMVTETGFRDLRTYGDSEFAPFKDSRSEHIIVIAKK